MGYLSSALVLLVLILQFRGSTSGSFCYELQYSYSYNYYYYGYYYYSYYTYYGYCDKGCCGYTTNRYCCSYSSSSNEAVIGIIIGCTVGGIAFLVMMIIAICCICKYVNKRDPQRGIVVAPAPQTARVNMQMQQPTFQGQYIPPPTYQPFPDDNAGTTSVTPIHI